MNAAEFRNEVLKHYLDGDLQVTINRDPRPLSTGNGLLHTAIAYSILHINGIMDESDKQRFAKCIDLCWVGSLNNPVIGLLERNDGRPDKEAHDDYHIVTTSFLLKTYHAEAIVNYGQTNCWSYDNTHPHNHSIFSADYWSSLHYRFPGLIAYYQLAAGKEPSWPHSNLLCSSINEVSKKSDHAFMQWLKVQVMKRCGKQKYVSSALIWESKARVGWGSLGNICKEYFGKDHPISQVPTIEGIF